MFLTMLRTVNCMYAADIMDICTCQSSGQSLPNDYSSEVCSSYFGVHVSGR